MLGQAGYQESVAEVSLTESPSRAILLLHLKRLWLQRGDLCHQPPSQRTISGMSSGLALRSAITASTNRVTAMRAARRTPPEKYACKLHSSARLNGVPVGRYPIGARVRLSDTLARPHSRGPCCMVLATAPVTYNLAAAYQVAGRTAEAIPLVEATLTDRERVLGRRPPRHPDVTQQPRRRLPGCREDRRGHPTAGGHAD